jgi:hypothetical protein
VVELDGDDTPPRSQLCGFDAFMQRSRSGECRAGVQLQGSGPPAPRYLSIHAPISLGSKRSR